MRWPWQKETVRDAQERDGEVVTVGGGGVDGMVDPLSTTWIVIEKWAKSEIDKLRIKNDSQRHGELRTAAIRGEIGRLKKLLSLPELLSGPGNDPPPALNKRPPVLAGHEERIDGW